MFVRSGIKLLASQPISHKLLSLTGIEVLFFAIIYNLESYSWTPTMFLSRLVRAKVVKCR